jgi:hypothetical protein
MNSSTHHHRQLSIFAFLAFLGRCHPFSTAAAFLRIGCVVYVEHIPPQIMMHPRFHCATMITLFNKFKDCLDLELVINLLLCFVVINDRCSYIRVDAGVGAPPEWSRPGAIVSRPDMRPSPAPPGGRNRTFVPNIEDHELIVMFTM